MRCKRTKCVWPEGLMQVTLKNLTPAVITLLISMLEWQSQMRSAKFQFIKKRKCRKNGIMALNYKETGWQIPYSKYNSGSSV